MTEYMAKEKEIKTNAMRILDRMKIPYTHYLSLIHIFFDNSLCAFHTLSLLHNARTNGSHLRTEVRTSDGSDCVAAECRTSHQQLVVQLFSARDRVDREIADFQLCAVCGQTSVDSCGYTRCV